MVNELPDPARFQKTTSSLITNGGQGGDRGGSRVAVCGECAPTLWLDGKVDAAIQLEHLWDEITKTYSVDVFAGIY